MVWAQEFEPGQRVMTREGYPGTILAEHTMIDATHYYVLLDDGQGEGVWSENELQPTTRTASLLHQAEVERRMASEDYPEIGEALDLRPDLQEVMSETEYMAQRLSMGRTALYLPLDAGAAKKSQGYEDGFTHGAERATQQPLRLDAHYMAEYLLGWADGVKTRGDVEDAAYTDDLATSEPRFEMTFSPIEGPVPGESMAITSAATSEEGMEHDAGILDFIRDNRPAPAENWSFDWCRFRRDSQCYLPKKLNRAASDLAGYAVWIPEKRGHCERISWEAQEQCPVGQPGPNVPGGFTDATIAWEAGGQRDGYVDQRIAAKDEAPDGWRDGDAVTSSYAEDYEDETIRHGEVAGEGYTGGSGLSGRTLSHLHGDSGSESSEDRLGSRGEGVPVRGGLGGDLWTDSAWDAPASSVSATEVRGHFSSGAHDGGGAFTGARSAHNPLPSGGTSSDSGERQDQRGRTFMSGVPAGQESRRVRNASTQPVGRNSDSWNWHYTAAWADVQRKGKRIFDAGGVRVLSVIMQDDGLHPEVFVTQVQGDSAVYQVEMDFVPGTFKVGAWTCDCPWNTYNWGRRVRPEWEGRACSHMMASIYAMQSQSMSGIPDAEQAIAPEWIPKAASTGPVVEQALARTGASLARLHALMAERGHEPHVAAEGTIRGKVNGQVVDLEFRDGQVYYRGKPFAGEVLWPDYDPTRGLHYAAQHTEEDAVVDADWALSLDMQAEAVLEDEPQGAVPVTYGDDEEDLSGEVTEEDVERLREAMQQQRPRPPRRPTASKTAARTFSRAEQDLILGEGEGTTARNLTALDITGTHYEHLPTHDPEDDPSFLW